MGLADQIWGEEVMRRLDRANGAAKEKETLELLRFTTDLVPDPRYFAAADTYADTVTPANYVWPTEVIDGDSITVTETITLSGDTAVAWLRWQVEEMCAAGRSSL